MKPQVSIIMATHNCAMTIRESLDSIVNQSFEDWEFIICDDCSSDDTVAILNEYSTLYPEKIVILTNGYNMKLSYSLNRCLQIAKGKYVARMDGDDISEPTRLQEQFDFLESHSQYSVVGTNMAQFDVSGVFGEIKTHENPLPQELLTTTPFCHATIMMRKSAYDAIGGYTVAKRTIRGQDIDLWFRFFKLGLIGYNIQKPLYRVREDRAAIRRRKLRYRIYESITRLKGFKLLGFPKYTYFFAALPIISFFIPSALKKAVRNAKMK